jgi:hypothetical protein
MLRKWLVSVVPETGDPGGNTTLGNVFSQFKDASCVFRKTAAPVHASKIRGLPDDAVARILFAQGSQQGLHEPAVALDD